MTEPRLHHVVIDRRVLDKGAMLRWIFGEASSKDLSAQIASTCRNGHSLHMGALMFGLFIALWGDFFSHGQSREKEKERERENEKEKEKEKEKKKDRERDRPPNR